jgi:hypothetical protein
MQGRQADLFEQAQEHLRLISVNFQSKTVQAW